MNPRLVVLGLMSAVALGSCGAELPLYHGDEGRGTSKQRWTVACVAWSADGRFGSG